MAAASSEAKTEVLTRLRTVKGHIAGIERMVEEEQTCGNILIQLSAIRASVEKIGIFILENHALECLTQDLSAPKEDRDKIEKVIKDIVAFLKK
jgi:DNA-binding FrmR family transcriptional regulator